MVGGEQTGQGNKQTGQGNKAGSVSVVLTGKGVLHLEYGVLEFGFLFGR